MTTAAHALRAAVLLVALAAPVDAQDLPTGTWTGTMVPPEGHEAPVTYDVTRSGGEIAITMTVEGTAPRVLEDVRVEGDRLLFAFQMAVRLSCDLQRKPDGTYDGTCSNDGRQSGRLTMSPPGGARPLARPSPSSSTIW